MKAKTIKYSKGRFHKSFNKKELLNNKKKSSNLKKLKGGNNNNKVPSHGSVCDKKLKYENIRRSEQGYLVICKKGKKIPFTKRRMYKTTLYSNNTGSPNKKSRYFTKINNKYSQCLKKTCWRRLSKKDEIKYSNLSMKTLDPPIAATESTTSTNKPMKNKLEELKYGPLFDIRDVNNQKNENIEWDYEENLAEGNCFYWASLRGLNRLAVNGSYKFSNRQDNKGYLGENINIHKGKLARGNPGNPKFTNKAVKLYQKQTNIIEKLRAALYNHNTNEFTAIHLKNRVWAQDEQIQVFCNYFNVGILIWKLVKVGICEPNEIYIEMNNIRLQCNNIDEETCNSSELCKWESNPFNAEWSLFIPNDPTIYKKTYNSGKLVNDDYLNNPEFDKKYNECKNIIYIQNIDSNHFILIEPMD